jgi:hypothetical protein
MAYSLYLGLYFMIALAFAFIIGRELVGKARRFSLK